jgi:hypothetical protein
VGPSLPLPASKARVAVKQILDWLGSCLLPADQPEGGWGDWILQLAASQGLPLVMKAAGIVSRRPRRFSRTTDSGYDLPIAENVLDQCFTVDAPNRAWVTDITYVGWSILTLITYQAELGGPLPLVRPGQPPPS